MNISALQRVKLTDCTSAIWSKQKSHRLHAQISGYDGYHTASGERLYNPRSVVCALTDNQLSNYWVSSGKYDSIFTYISHNVDEIQNDLTLMFAGEKIPTGIQEYAATAPELKTKEEIYSAMVVYFLLTYDNGKVFIPNNELF